MKLNRVIFPAPISSYELETYPGLLVWIPHQVKTQSPSIPCLYLQQSSGSSKLLLYFHGNAEDAGTSFEMCSTLRARLNVHVLVVEYPGYGLHPGQPSERSICATADAVVAYLTQEMEWPADDIIVLGRSIGSGPACYLAAKTRFCCLVLVSAYTSIKAVVGHVAGKLAQLFVAQRFKNIEAIKSVTCPVFFLHGLRDTLIPAWQSQELHSKCHSPCHIHLPPAMTHNNFDHLRDLVQPLAAFLAACKITTSPRETGRSLLLLPERLYRPPPGLLD